MFAFAFALQDDADDGGFFAAEEGEDAMPTESLTSAAETSASIYYGQVGRGGSF
jgi:hypothetical protein